jgi:hypothetical protein
MFVRLHLNGKSWAWWHAPVIPMTVGSLKWEDHSPGQPGQKARFFSTSRITRAKMTGGVTQVTGGVTHAR